MTENELYSKYVFTLYEVGNMTKAAKLLGISQPALSAGISTLEKKLGVALFDRKKTPISLTDEGRVYVDYLNRERNLWEDLQKQFADIQDAGSGSVVVGGPITYIEYILLPACEGLKKEFPNCKISIKEGTIAEMAEKVAHGEVDFFISTKKHHSVEITDEYIKDEKIYLCVPKEAPIAKKLKQKNTDFSCLEGMDFVFLEDNQPMQLELNRFLREQHISVRKSFEVSQVTTALSLCARGAGLCISSDSALEASGMKDKFKIYRLPTNSEGRKIYISYGTEKYLNELCRRLMEIISGRELR